MFLILCIVLLVAWLLGFVMFHVAGALIHLLLLVAVISLILHFVRGRKPTEELGCHRAVGSDGPSITLY
jgi:Family of unknown function (DUF5670)